MKKHLFPSLLFMIFSLLISCSSGEKEKPSKKENTIALIMEEDAESLDPRFVRSLNSATVSRLFFEGLMTVNSRGKLEKAIVDDYEISEDGKIYTFTLKDAYWSDKQPVTAMDFVTSWKSILDPKTPAPNAYQFFSIKNAKLAKSGKISLDEVGITAKDSKTLVVELEEPNPSFLNLIATHYYFPVKFTQSDNPQLLYNGPFLPESWKKQQEIVAVKNNNYRESEKTKLDKIILMVVEDKNTALQMYEMGTIDWAGSPLSTLPTDSMTHLKQKKQLRNMHGAGTYWFRFNTTKYPLNNVNIRKALTIALNRHDLVEHVIQGYQQPALHVVPPSFGLNNHSTFQDNDVPQAWEYFQKGLNELQITIEEFPALKLCYQTNERSNKIAQAVQQQWKKSLGVNIELENCEKQLYYSKLSHLDYEISLGGWFADFHDPLNFLEVFSSANNGSNNTGWENAEYKQLLEHASKESDKDQRFKLLAQAEKLLLTDLPIAPLYHPSLNFLYNKKIKNVEILDLGYLDFKEAYIKHDEDY